MKCCSQAIDEGIKVSYKKNGVPMKQVSKLLMLALFGVSMLGITSCGRFSDCFCDPCGWRCPPKCSQPCGQPCSPQVVDDCCTYTPACPPKCDPCPQPRCEQPCAPRCAPRCEQPCAPRCEQPCAPRCEQPCAPRCAPRCCP